MRSFGSDNHAGVHPQVWQAMQRASADHCVAYGEDRWTEEARKVFREHFGEQCEVGFVFNGTAANVLGLSTLAKSFEAVICAETAHIHNDECGAPERFGGFKLLTVPTRDGKLTTAQLGDFLKARGNVHHNQPRILSLTQSTEVGTTYRPEEIGALSEWAHRQGMLVHMDGARLANAAAFLDKPLRAFTTDVGVDVLSFGGTKNGLMIGEAVVFLQAGLGADFGFRRKQGMQLASKMRFLSTQFLAFLSDDLYLRNARHANAMARELAARAAKIEGVRITQPVEANGVFVQLPKPVVEPLQKDFFFYLWDEKETVARWMCAFDTTIDDIEGLTNRLAQLVKEKK